MLLRLTNEANSYNFTGYTFILPAVSVGHVGQLAVDLLMASIEPSPILYALVDHKAFSPVAGFPGHNSSADLLGPCEIYVAEEQKTVIMQIRSSVLKVHEEDMLNQFLEWFMGHKFGRLVLLSSSFSENRLDCQINTSALRYFGTNLSSDVTDSLKQYGLLELEKKPMFTDKEVAMGWEISGAGFTSRFFQICNERNLDIVCILAFSFEGGAISEASQMVNVLSRWGNFHLKTVAPPGSWEMFSNQPHPVAIFP